MMRVGVLSLLMVGVLAVLVSPVPALAQSVTGNLPIPLLIQETSEELVSRGCRQFSAFDPVQKEQITNLGWISYVPSDANGEDLIACPIGISVTKITATSGQVAGIKDLVPAADAGTASWIFSNAVLPGFLKGLAPGVPVDGLITAIDSTVFETYVAKPVREKAATFVLENIIWLFTLITVGGYWVMGFLLAGITPLLRVGGFVDNSIVRTFWPIVLGLANLGFMIALLLIALFTALRLEVGGGVRRLLPRLLLAALLVNFSLVIAGVIVDISRVVMAVIASTVLRPGETFANLPNLMWGSMQIQLVELGLRASFSSAVMSFLYMIVIWFVVIALMVVFFTLLMRYVMLVFLLVISPMAFLFMAFPGASGLARKWWVTFFRYVFYGPIILFILLGSIRIPQDAARIFTPVFKQLLPVWVPIFSILTIAVLYYFAAMAGRYAGMLGATAAVNVASGRNKGFNRVVGRGAGAAYVGLGGRKAVRRIRDTYRDFSQPLIRTFAKGIRNAKVAGFPVGKFLLGPERDKDGNLLKGETGFAERTGRGWAAKTGLYPKGTTVYGWEKAMRGAGTTAADVRDETGAYANVENDRVGTAMKFKHTKAVLDTALHHSTDKKDIVKDFERLQTMVNNEYAYNNINEAERGEISTMTLDVVIENINTRRVAAGKGALDPKDKEDAQIMSRLDRLVRDTRRQAGASRKQVIKPEWI